MDKKETHLIGHLEELRRRIIVTLAAFFLFLITAFLFVQDIYDWLIRDLPKRAECKPRVAILIECQLRINGVIII